MRKGRKGKKENGWHGHYGLPAWCRPIHHGLPMRTTTGTCVSGGLRVLHADDGNGGWREFAGDKVGAADSFIWAVVVMVIIVAERIKRSRREEVVGGQLKWAVDKS